MSLGSEPNVYNTCLPTLRSRGFALHFERELDADGAIPSMHFGSQ